MELWQSSHIQRNLKFLTNNTICNTLFLACLRQANVLSANDISKLEAKGNQDGRYAKSAMLYEIVQTKKDAYNALVEALRETVQTGSLSRLEQARSDNTIVIFESKEIKDSTYWDQLSNELKNEMGNKVVFYQGKLLQLKKLANICDLSVVDGKILVELAKNEKPCIVNIQIPDKLEYYIQRSIKSRNKVNKKVLQQVNTKDIFVIEGVEQFQISLLVPEEKTDVSGNQLRHLSVRFIVLECDQDFDIICALSNSKGKPVHKLRWVDNDNLFEVIESHGSIENLQEYVYESEDSYPEAELVSSKNKVFVISDSPGMGKTCLLSNIAQQILNSGDEGDPMPLVRFIVMKELVQTVNEKQIQLDSIVKIIAEQSSIYHFGRKLVEYTLQNLPCTLMIDGFDEVLSHQVNAAEKILKAFRDLKLARVFVSTRPHFRKHLENSLNSLANTIQPFNRSNQIDFLEKFWKLKGAYPNDSLNKFATACLDEITSKMTDFERNIAGIPLQCRLIAETYVMEATRCSRLGFKACQNSLPKIINSSMFEIYEKHMNKKFQQILITNESLISRIKNIFVNRKSQLEAIKHAHMLYALRLLYPYQVEKFQSLTSSNNVALSDLCGLGLLEATNSDDIRFVHRTFAEFLVAWFVNENVFNIKFRDFILSQVLKTTTTRIHYFQFAALSSFRFDYPVICYFLNGFNQEHEIYGDTEISPASLLFSDFHNHVTPIFLACAVHNFSKLPRLVVILFTNNFSTSQSMMVQEISVKSLREILFVISKNSEVELMSMFWTKNVDAKMVSVQYTEGVEFHTFTLTPLHLAVERGNYSLVEYLILKYEKELANLQYLVHICVRKTSEVRNNPIQEKIQIIKLLSKKNKNWLAEKTDRYLTPLFRNDINPKLLECLIEVGGDFNIFLNETTLLHQITANPISPESYHKVFEAVIKRGFHHINKSNLEDRTPLQCAVWKVELLEKTVELFKAAGADFDVVDRLSNSLLFYAIRGGRKVKLVQALIKHVTEWKSLNKIGQSMLHICAENGNYEVLRYLIETYPQIDINAHTFDLYRTPLHYAVQKLSENHEKIQKFLINNGAGVNTKAVNRIPFIEAFMGGEGLSLSVIQLMEQNGLVITSEVASEALTQELLRKFQFEDKSWKWKSHWNVEALLYLIAKGGQVNLESISNVWKWKGMKEYIPDIIANTEINSVVLDYAKSMGLITKAEGEFIGAIPSEILRSKSFYEIVQERADSLERVYTLLISNYQFSAFQHLKRGLETVGGKFRTTIFVTPPPGLVEFIHSQKKTLMVLSTNSYEFTLRRMDETIDVMISLIEDLALYHDPGLKIVILQHGNFDYYQKQLKKLQLGVNNKLICLCSHHTYKSFLNASDKIENCQLEIDTFTWKDVSRSLIDKLWCRIGDSFCSVTEMFPAPRIMEAIWPFVRKELKAHNYMLFKITDLKVGHSINSVLHQDENEQEDETKYLSCRLFHYFVPDKLLFINVTKEKLREYGNYGHKIGHFGEDIETLDFMILQRPDQFSEICKSTSSNVHLIQQSESQFRVVNSQGSVANLRKFFENKRVYCKFPHCDCAHAKSLIVQLFYQVESIAANSEYEYGEPPRQRFKWEINIDQLQPKLRQVVNLRLSNSLNLYELMGLLKATVSTSANSSFENIFGLNELKLKSYVEQMLILICYLIKYLKCGDDELNTLRKIGLRTLFPELESTSEISKMERFVELGILRYTEEEKHSLIFVNNTLALYFFIEGIVNQESNEEIECTNEIFKAYFETYTLHITHGWWSESKYYLKPIHSFKFVNETPFLFLNSLATEKNKKKILTLLAPYITPESACKWVHACVNHDVFGLLTLVLQGQMDKKSFESEGIVVLAIQHGDVQVIDLVAKQYELQTGKKLTTIMLELENEGGDSMDAPSYSISILHVAAMRGYLSILKNLVENHGFKLILDLPIMRNILRFCVIDSQNKIQGSKPQDNSIEQKFRLIEFLVQIDPTLIQEKLPRYHPLLVPNIHVDLIIHLINLGANVLVADGCGDTILHLSPLYLTHTDYDKLVQVLFHTRGAIQIFNLKNKSQKTPLQMAVRDLELQESTIEAFSMAKVDFNMIDTDGKTILAEAVDYHRSARVLDSLIIRTNMQKLNAELNSNSNLLQLAIDQAMVNYTAVRYLIWRDCDVIVTKGMLAPPLYLALQQFAYTYDTNMSHEIVKSLVEHGVNVNAIGMVLNRIETPLAFASLEDTYVSDKTIQFLKESGAKMLPTIEDIKLAFDSWKEFVTKTVNELTKTGGVKRDNINSYENLSKQEMVEVKRHLTNWESGPDAFDALLKTLKTMNQMKAYMILERNTFSWNKALMEMLANNTEHWTFDIVEFVVKTYPGVLQSRHSINNSSLLHHALRFNTPNENKLGLIEMLITLKADVNAKDEDNSTPLHYLVLKEPVSPSCFINVLTLMIENGSDPDAKDNVGRTILHTATSYITPEMYSQLVLYFDSPGKRNSLKMNTIDNLTPLHSAVENFEPCLETLEIFKRNGVDFNAQNDVGISPLFSAIEGGRNVKFLEILFKFGADWKILNKWRETPLHVAATYGNLSALKLFIELECDVNATDYKNQTPLHNAFMCSKRQITLHDGFKYYTKYEIIKNQHEIVKELLEHGANVKARDKDGNLPIDLAKEKLEDGKVEIRTFQMLRDFQYEV